MSFHVVGTARFELATSSTPRKRSTKLSYVPNSGYYTDLFASCQGIADKNEVRQVSDLFLSQSFFVICFIRRSAPISTPVSRATCSMVRPARRRARALLMDSSSCAAGCRSQSIYRGIGAGCADLKAFAAASAQVAAVQVAEAQRDAPVAVPASRAA